MLLVLVLVTTIRVEMYKFAIVLTVPVIILTLSTIEFILSWKETCFKDSKIQDFSKYIRHEIVIIE